ncbi:MAG TPA: glycosyltransferase family 9 protein [Steroidobacteraceae bacterium]|jgi:ADP-heptose:LPS heptosyltransferase|nr:glycosyltransferase family 9 protein [Steroidobacteraceae bacterium]
MSFRLRISRGLADLRHRFRRGMGRVLGGLFGPRRLAGPLDLTGVRTILVCRINGRMGNTLFLTPLIRHLHGLLPDAAIDLALAYKHSPQLLGDMPGVREIFIFPHKTDHMARRFIGALRRLRARRYDLAIDPVPESNSGRVVMTLCRADRRLGFVTDRQWAPLTHAVPPPREITHQAAHPIYLLDKAIGRSYDAAQVRLSLPLRAEELSTGRALIERSIASLGTSDTRRVIGFFAHAAGYKMLGREWWAQFWQTFMQLEPDAIALECQPGADLPATVDGIGGFHEPSPRALAAAIACMRVFVSTDTGPMHLASCTDVPTVALFRASDPLQYGPLKPSDVSIDVGHTGPADAARICQRVWQASRVGIDG